MIMVNFCTDRLSCISVQLIIVIIIITILIVIIVCYYMHVQQAAGEMLRQLRSL